MMTGVDTNLHYSIQDLSPIIVISGLTRVNDMRQQIPFGLALTTMALFLALGCDKKPPPSKASPNPAVKPETLKPQFDAGNKADGFTMAISADPETFDTAKMSGAPEGRIAFNLFEGLMMPGKTTENVNRSTDLVTYGVAESHTVSEDGRTYTFTLRKDALWSTGDPVTAEDFVYSWKRVLSPDFAADYANMLWRIEGAEAYNKGTENDWSKVGIHAKDANTLEVKLNGPVPYFLELVAFYTFFPVPQKAVEKHGEAWTRPENIVTNGAYRLAEYKPQQHIVLEANPKYWDAKNVSLPKATLRIITDATARVNAYKTGALHWTGGGLPLAQITSLLTHPHFRQEPYMGVYYYRVNVSTKDSPLNDKRVRQALSLATDRAGLVDNTLNGLFEVAMAFVPPISGYSSTATTDYSVKKARGLMAEAGFPKGEGFPKVQVLYNTDENHKLVAESIQDMWKRSLGIDVELVNSEWKTYLQNVDSLNYQVARAGWIGDFNDPMTFLDMWVTDNGNNDTGWSNAEYDRLIMEAQAETNIPKRLSALQKAETILLDDGPVIPIYFYTNNMLVSSELEGFEPHNRDIHLLKYLSLKEKP
jgi:oligopeptide transport system substrate-binding protein